MPQPGFFDLDERYAKLNERDPLVKLNQIIDWEAFREPLSVLRDKPRKSLGKVCKFNLSRCPLSVRRVHPPRRRGVGRARP